MHSSYIDIKYTNNCFFVKNFTLMDNHTLLHPIAML